MPEKFPVNSVAAKASRLIVSKPSIVIESINAHRTDKVFF